MKYKIQKFMSLRYGVDDLYIFLFKICIVLLICRLFIKNNIFTILELLIFIIMCFRFFSKNIYARRLENQKFLKLKESLGKPFLNIKRNLQDKTHIYKKCSKCKTTLRLPLPAKIGIKYTKCPDCGKRVRLLALKHKRS